MPEPFLTRVKRGWNAFQNRDPTSEHSYDNGPGYGRRPDRVRMSYGNERSIVLPLYNKLALDVASMTIQHVKLDAKGRFASVVDSDLNECLTLQANIDQTGKAFLHDVVMSMCDEGTVAMVPIDTTDNPNVTGAYDIQSLRTSRILQWYPRKVQVEPYNDRTGLREQLTFSKDVVGIVENPLYAVMNEPNSILKRLIRKLNLLDAIDEQSGSGKLDLIIGLPYPIKTESRRQEALKRRSDIVSQLSDSKYGVVYTDATEKVTQLNRPVENNLMKQIEFLTVMLYSQLGLTQGVFDGTASQDELTNYFNRSIQPIVAAIVDEMNRKFLTKTARSQKQIIRCFQDPFKFIPVGQLSEVADKFSRNEIMSPNEFRDKIGMKPSDDPKSDDLRNRNIAEPNEQGQAAPSTKNNQNGREKQSEEEV